MKITHIDVISLQKKLSSSMQISRGGFAVRNHTLVQVHTDEGISGLGEGVGNAHLVKAILKEQMCDLATGMDPFNIELLRNRLMDSQVYFERKGSALCAASAIEMACWDIKGKALDQPVYQLLGGLYRDRLEVYASDIYWEENPEDMAADAVRIVELGFHTLKAHIGYKSPKEDYTRIQAIRKAIGYEIELMIDLNCGYDLTQATQAINLWEEFDLKWIEEPLNPNHIHALADLRSKSNIPIACGENEFQIYGFKSLFDQKAIDVAMPDIGRAGGIQETKNICTLAQAYGVPVSPHNFSSGILLAATIHLMASTPNTGLLELDTSKNAILEELLLAPLSMNDGFVSVPSFPGLGVELKKEILEQFTI